MRDWSQASGVGRHSHWTTREVLKCSTFTNSSLSVRNIFLLYSLSRWVVSPSTLLLMWRQNCFLAPTVIFSFHFYNLKVNVLVAQTLYCLSLQGICLRCRGLGFNPWVRRPPGEGNGNPLQGCWLENSMGRGAWQAAVHGIAESDTVVQLTGSQFVIGLWFLPGEYLIPHTQSKFFKYPSNSVLCDLVTWSSANQPRGPKELYP